MRRMYSKQELTNVIKAVFDQELEDGALYDKVVDAVDDYLTEHPVDPTAITGLDIAPKDVTASGNITAPSIIENMSGYSFAEPSASTKYSVSLTFAGIVKNGNKLTLAIAGSFSTLESLVYYDQINVGTFTIPSAVGEKLYPFTQGSNTKVLTEVAVILNNSSGTLTEVKKGISFVLKDNNTTIPVIIYPAESGLDASKTFNFRVEATFLLSENLISE